MYPWDSSMSIIVGEGMVKGNMDARMNGYPDGRRERNVSLSGRFRLVESAAVHKIVQRPARAGTIKYRRFPKPSRETFRSLRPVGGRGRVRSFPLACGWKKECSEFSFGLWVEEGVFGVFLRPVGGRGSVRSFPLACRWKRSVRRFILVCGWKGGGRLMGIGRRMCFDV